MVLRCDLLMCDVCVNFIGYNDLGSYGSPTIETPNIDRIGASGARFTQFYVSAPLCTPSRASLLTGRLPIRSGIYTDFDYPVDSIFRVFYPTSVGCLPQEEVTIGEALKPVYSTLMVGKWSVYLTHTVYPHIAPTHPTHPIFLPTGTSDTTRTRPVCPDMAIRASISFTACPTPTRRVTPVPCPRDSSSPPCRSWPPAIASSSSPSMRVI